MQPEAVLQFLIHLSEKTRIFPNKTDESYSAGDARRSRSPCDFVQLPIDCPIWNAHERHREGSDGVRCCRCCYRSCLFLIGIVVIRHSLGGRREGRIARDEIVVDERHEPIEEAVRDEVLDAPIKEAKKVTIVREIHLSK